jgi:large subunit ribosomal protein L7/L12
MSQQQQLEKLVEALSALSVLDMSKLKVILEEKWGVRAAVAMAALPAQTASSEAAQVAESTDFEVILEGPIPDDKKIAVIKAVREVTGLGLKEAKEAVEGVPKTLKASVPKVEAKSIQSKLQTAGASVKLKGL